MGEAYKTLRLESKEGALLITIDNPPVNQMSPVMWGEFTSCLEWALGESGVKAIIITGTGKNFIAGADILELKKASSREVIHEAALRAARFLNFIESGPKPIICAINGNALGGGLETAMACHYRLATNNARLGQPEVQIGLIPGAGGTQRLPRLIGLPNAIKMITQGDPIDAMTAYRWGLVDAVVSEEALIPSALDVAQRFIRREFNLRHRVTKGLIGRLPSQREKELVIQSAREVLRKKAKGYIAPFKALEAMEKGLGFNMEADIEREVALFAECAVSGVAKNLIGIFLNTRAAGRLPRIEGVAPQGVRKVAVLGGGVMGSSILHLLLMNGFETALWEIDQDALGRAMNAVTRTFDYHLKNRLIKKEKLDSMLSSIKTTTSIQDLEGSDLVIEAVLEDMKVKQRLWLELEGLLRPDVVFGTNTSALPITEMASVLRHPERLIGLHFFNPAHRMKLLEVILTKVTSDKTLRTAIELARRLKKVPVVVNDGPGFYVSRQLGGLMGGSVFLMADGVDFQAIDKAMVEFGMPMGPATLSDLTGIDINYHVGRTFYLKLGERYRPHPLTELIYKTGSYGRKTGSGYYDYSKKEPVPNPKVVEVIRSYWDANGISPKEMDPKEIVECMVALGINEACLIMEEGICDRPQDMDLAMIYGTGFPPYRGGLLRYADNWGLENVYSRLLELESRYGHRFTPSSLLKEMAEKGEKFYRD